MAGEGDFDLGVTIRSFGPGQKLFGRYTLVRALGRGGMGVVWLARDGDLERDVALKFLPEMVAADPVAIDDLKHETRRSLELTHPHIVRVHDFIQADGVAAISMEFVKGRTLAEVRIEQPARAFRVDEIAPWMRQMCEALHYAHVHARVVHRDLKPANVMVDERNRIKLTDFGISATVSDTVTRVSRVATTGGTAAYASPQQLMGEPACPADDIYALGATVYELLTSRPPFFTGNLLLQVQNRVPPPMRERRSELSVDAGEIPHRWEEVVAAALSKNPAERPGSIEEFAHRLDLAGVFAPDPRSESQVDPSFTQAATIVSLGAPTRPTGAGVPPLPVSATSGTRPPPPLAPHASSSSAASPASAPSEVVSAKHVPPPAEALTKDPPRRRGIGGWVLVVVLVVAIGAGIWYADVPNRVLASQSVKDAQRAQLGSDLDGALEEFREAVLLRPGDAGIREQFDAAQNQWLEALQSRVAALAPTAALAEVERAAEVATRLVEPQASRFRALETDLKQRIRSEGEEAIRREIDVALRLADEGDVGAAVAALDRIALQGLLDTEIAAARAGAASRAARANVGRFADALRDGDAARLAEVVERATGRPTAETSTHAREMLQAASPDAMFDAISRAGMALPTDVFDTLPADLALVAQTRNRFSDTAAVRQYLARRFSEVARRFLDDNMPGFALYAAAQTRAEGGSVDPRIERDARQRLIYEFGHRIHLADTEQSSGGGGVNVPAGSVRAALRESLEARLGDWVKVVELAPLDVRHAIVLQTRMMPMNRRDDRSETSETVQYQAGTRNERNPEYERVAGELAEARRESADLDAQMARLERGGDSKGEAVLRGVLTIGLHMRAQQARQRVSELTDQLEKLPATVPSPVYRDEPYKRINHRIAYSTAFTALPTYGSRSATPGGSWTAEVRHETFEVSGNASRGVPVRQAVFPADATVAAQLAEALAETVKKEHGQLTQSIASLSWIRLDEMLKGASAPPAAVLDRRWGLLQLWNESGVRLPQEGELERGVRGQLGLPSASIAQIPAPEARRSAETTSRSAQSPAAEPIRDREISTYTVRAGDTAQTIARALGIPLEDLAAANPGLTRGRLRTGQVLIVPAQAPQRR
jgi:serine/threonine protein kinase